MTASPGNRSSHDNRATEHFPENVPFWESFGIRRSNYVAWPCGETQRRKLFSGKCTGRDIGTAARSSPAGSFDKFCCIAIDHLRPIPDIGRIYRPTVGSSALACHVIGRLKIGGASHQEPHLRCFRLLQRVLQMWRNQSGDKGSRTLQLRTRSTR